MPIPPPAGMVAPAGRDLPLAAAAGETLHVDLIPSRHIRGVGQTSTVGRERSRSFIDFRTDYPELLPLPTPGHRQGPDIHFRHRITFVIDDETPVPRPVGGVNGVLRLQQLRLLSGAASRLLIEAHDHVTGRSPDDGAPVRRPDGDEILRRIEGEALGVAPRYVK